MKFRPLHDRVVIRRIEGEEKTKGGIIIPDTAKEKPQEGEVIAVGPGARDESGKLISLDIKAGDRVLFGKWSGTEVKIDGRNGGMDRSFHESGKSPCRSFEAGSAVCAPERPLLRFEDEGSRRARGQGGARQAEEGQGEGRRATRDAATDCW